MKILSNLMYVKRLGMVGLLLISWMSSVYAEGGGGGGGIGGEGASGPEPQTWFFMIFATLVLFIISIYRARISRRDVK